MSWRDRFTGTGSFRGAAFDIQESPAQFGRRNQLHEYPQRDTPWSEDLGRKARQWTIEAVVIGEDYDLARDALIKALETAGPGALVHPYLGTVQATVGQCQVVDSTAHGGMATFSMPFTEAGVDTEPAATPDTGTAANLAAANVQAASAASVTANLDVTQGEAFVGQAGSDLLGSMGQTIGGALAAVQPFLADPFSTQRQVAAIAAGGVALLTQPAALVAGVFGAIAGVGDLATYSDDAIGQLGAMISFGAGLPPVIGSTPSRLAQATNQTTLVNLVRCAAAAATVNQVAQSVFSSYDEAAAVRDPLADQLDALATLIADGGEDNLAASIDALRLAMVRDVTARGASLARLYAYTPAACEPAVVIAQRLYGDASFADDIVARNAVDAPLFIPGGAPIEVINVAV
ncbi:MAG: DNA circularization protein [Caulobacteraceae bacterium]